MKIIGEARDLVFINFALKMKEIERITPDSVNFETRIHENEEYGFIKFGFLTFTEFFGQNFPPLSLSFPCSFLAVCARNSRGNQSYFIKNIYAPRIQSFLFKWWSGFPSSSISLDFPSRTHPGGEYKWHFEGNRKGNLVGKIERGNSVSGRLPQFFESDQELVDYFLNRSNLIAGSSRNRQELDMTFSPADFHPITFDKLELGFLASDFERNSFPEAILGSYYIPDASLTFETS